MDPHISNTYIFNEWIKNRINNNKNCIIVIVGATGSGKTWSSITLAKENAETFGSHFSVRDNLAFNFQDIINKTHIPANQNKGTPFIFEEVGVIGGGASSKDWYNQINKLFNSWLQTVRHRNQILFFTTPNFAFLEKGSRQLVHCVMTTIGIDMINKLTILSPIMLQVDSLRGKIYYKRLRFKDKDGNKFKLGKLRVNKPSDEMIKEYDVEKRKFTDALETKATDHVDKNADDYVKRVNNYVKIEEPLNPNSMQPLIWEIAQKGYTHEQEIADELGKRRGKFVYLSAISENAARMRKKGYDIRQFKQKSPDNCMILSKNP